MVTPTPSSFRGPAFTVAGVLISGLAATLSDLQRNILWAVALVCLGFGLYDTIRSWAAEKAYFKTLFQKIRNVFDSSKTRPVIVEGRLVQGGPGEIPTLHLDLTKLPNYRVKKNILTFTTILAFCTLVFCIFAFAVSLRHSLDAPYLSSASYTPSDVRHPADKNLTEAQVMRKILHFGDSKIASFPPPDWATKNEDGSPRIFVHESVAKLMERFKGFTALQASEASQPFIGKWVAVAGTVAEISPLGELITVRTVEGTVPPVLINFRSTDADSLKVFNPGDHIKAVCQIVLLDYERLFLNYCRVVP